MLMCSCTFYDYHAIGYSKVSNPTDPKTQDIYCIHHVHECVPGQNFEFVLRRNYKLRMRLVAPMNHPGKHDWLQGLSLLHQLIVDKIKSGKPPSAQIKSHNLPPTRVRISCWMSLVCFTWTCVHTSQFLFRSRMFPPFMNKGPAVLGVCLAWVPQLPSL